MQVHKPVTDAGLIFGSIFVAVSIVGIGILGDQHAPDQMAFIAPTAMTAMAAAPAGVTKEQQAYCTTGTKNTADALQSNCVPGCEYQVLEHGSSPLITVIKGPNPVPKAGSTEKLPPGSVTYVVGSMGGPNPGGGSSDPSTYGPMTCVAGKSGAPPSIGGAINQSQYGSSIGAHLQGDTATFQGQSSSAPGVTPASAPASSAAQGQPSATSPCGNVPSGFACGGAGVGLYSPCNVIEAGYSLYPGETPCGTPGVVPGTSGTDNPSTYNPSADQPPPGYKETEPPLTSADTNAAGQGKVTPPSPAPAAPAAPQASDEVATIVPQDPSADVNACEADSKPFGCVLNYSDGTSYTRVMCPDGQLAVGEGESMQLCYQSSAGGPVIQEPYQTLPAPPAALPPPPPTAQATPEAPPASPSTPTSPPQGVTSPGVWNPVPPSSEYDNPWPVWITKPKATAGSA